MYLQTLAKLLPSFPLPVVPLQILDLALSVLDISLFVFWVIGWWQGLATEYLTYQSERLRPGSLQGHQVCHRALGISSGNQQTWRHHPSTGQGGAHSDHTAVPQRAEVQGRTEGSILTQLAKLSAEWNLTGPWHPKPKHGSGSTCCRSLTGVWNRENSVPTLGTPDHQRKARGLPS